MLIHAQKLTYLFHLSLNCCIILPLVLKKCINNLLRLKYDHFREKSRLVSSILFDNVGVKLGQSLKENRQTYVICKIAVIKVELLLKVTSEMCSDALVSTTCRLIFRLLVVFFSVYEHLGYHEPAFSNGRQTYKKSNLLCSVKTISHNLSDAYCLVYNALCFLWDVITILHFNIHASYLLKLFISLVVPYYFIISLCVFSSQCTFIFQMHHQQTTVVRNFFYTYNSIAVISLV